MLQNAYFVAKIGADTAENERTFAEHLPKIGNYLTGPLPYGSQGIPSPVVMLEQVAGRGGAALIAAAGLIAAVTTHSCVR